MAVLLAVSYDAWVEATDRLLASIAPDEYAAILGGNAVAFHRL